jgi:transcriptional regulator with XRE-family HTH domain
MAGDEVEQAAIQSVAANVLRLRKERALSQEQLAEAAGVDAKSLQLIERGTGNPTARLLVRIAVALGVQTGRLFETATPPPRTIGRPRGRHVSTRRNTRAKTSNM